VLTTWPKVPQTTLGELRQLQEVRGEPHPEPTLPPDAAACIGERLRAHDALLMNGPVLDDLVRILEALDQKRRLGDGR